MNFSIHSKISIFIIIILIVSLIILYICNCILDKNGVSIQDCNCSVNSNKQVQNHNNLRTITEKNNRENFTQKNKLCLYYTEWCGYSQQFLPEWKKLKSEILSSELKNKIDIFEYNCETDKDTCMSANVRGYPTVILHKLENGEFKNIQYNGPRETQEIIKFVEKTI